MAINVLDGAESVLGSRERTAYARLTEGAQVLGNPYPDFPDNRFGA